VDYLAAVALDIQTVGGPDNACTQKLSWLYVLQNPTTETLKFPGAPGKWKNTSRSWEGQPFAKRDCPSRITFYTYWPWSQSHPDYKPDVPNYLATENQDRRGNRDQGFRFHMAYCTSYDAEGSAKNPAGNALCVLTLQKAPKPRARGTTKGEQQRAIRTFLFGIVKIELQDNEQRKMNDETLFG
jgi:hypothetical protein